MALHSIILAAGSGKRMHSALPKVLHKIAGKSLLEHIVDTLKVVPAIQNNYVVCGNGGDVLRQTLAHLNVTWVEQKQQLGTGHAVAQVLPHLADTDRVLILYGDVPLITVATLQNFIEHIPADSLGMLTATLADANGFGRIVRDKNQQIVKVVEHKDASAAEQQIKEINVGMYLVPVKYLRAWLPKLSNHNVQAEYYLPEICHFALQEKVKIVGLETPTPEEVRGVNDCLQLAELERYFQRRCAEQLLRQGVTLFDPQRFDVRGELTVGKDVVIDINVIIEGKVVIGDNCHIGPNVVLRDAVLGKQVEIKAGSVIEGATIADHCKVGPYARLRPGTQLAEEVHVGNFVELKNTKMGAHSKANHLSYVGDSKVGMRVNIGAGSITCNYDGVNKFQTTIGDGAFIGSNAVLIAPLNVGDGAYIAAGSTITREAPAQQLTIGRAKQRSIEGWQRPKKKESDACAE